MSIHMRRDDEWLLRLSYERRVAEDERPHRARELHA